MVIFCAQEIYTCTQQYLCYTLRHTSGIRMTLQTAPIMENRT